MTTGISFGRAIRDMRVPVEDWAAGHTEHTLTETDLAGKHPRIASGTFYECSCGETYTLIVWAR